MLPGKLNLREKGFYVFGSRTGRRPVRVWIGRVDTPAELSGEPPEPIVSTVIASMREGMPWLGHAPFALSALLSEPFEEGPAFDLTRANFEAGYLKWRRQWDAGQAEAWEEGPAEVYESALKHLMKMNRQ